MEEVSDFFATYEFNLVFRLESLINKNILLQPFVNSVQFGFMSNKESVNFKKNESMLNSPRN